MSSEIAQARDALHLLVQEGVVSDLLRRKHRGSPGLAAQFKATLASAGIVEPTALKALLRRFVATAHFEAYREIPTAQGKGASIEEAFFRFLDEQDIGDPHIRTDEFWTAMLSALAVQPSPLFRLPAGVERTRMGYRHRERGPTGAKLYATVGDRFLCGSLTPLLLDVLDADGVFGSAPAPQAWATCANRLRGLGLIG